jgi:hypothetical protein
MDSMFSVDLEPIHPEREAVEGWRDGVNKRSISNSKEGY